jgi:hypothetical protein
MQEICVPVGTIANFRTNKKNFAGRIIKIPGQGDSRIWEQNKSNVPGDGLSSAARSRIASTKGFQTANHNIEG